MNDLGLAKQMMQLSGGYREQKRPSGNGKWRRRIRRSVICILLLFFCILGVRRGINAYLAKQAEGKLQTASSYQSIYQSFERVEMNQLHLRKKWENHRGINLSIDMGGVNLSAVMCSSGSAASSAVSSVLGAVRDVTGVGGFGIGQYRQYMMAVSGENDSSAISQLPAAEPDQFLVQGEYIYTLWLREESEGWIEPSLVIYHAAGGQMEQVYESAWKMSGSYETEMMISGNYLYLAMNDAPGDVYYDKMDISGTPESCLLYIYDITNPAKPQRKDTLAQYGSYYSMKLSGEYLYLLSKFQDFAAHNYKDVDAYIPMVGEEKISSKNIYMQRDLYGAGYVVMSAYHLSDSGEPELTDAKAVAGTGDCIQWSSDTIYICSQVVPKHSDRTDRTGVTVLSCQDGRITGKEHLIVEGSVDMTQETDLNDGRLHLPMEVHTYRGEFVEIEDWILPGWESAPMKIQMQEDAVHTEKQKICIDENGEGVQEVDAIFPKEKIRGTGFEGELFEVDEINYIGVGHTDEDKHLKLLWYTFSVDGEPELKTSVSLREYRSPAAIDGRMVYFDQEHSLLGFCAAGSEGTFYYLYCYRQSADTDAVEIQELFQENFGIQRQAYWIRGTMLHPEDNMLYLIRSSGTRINGLAKSISMS
ncbi:MAG: beta-propeller domain-containing protein [Lachnospiraceae bacterium]|nr:beta-propeller domain-containing protein [Lachnospiraceae bacterium]